MRKYGNDFDSFLGLQNVHIVVGNCLAALVPSLKLDKRLSNLCQKRRSSPDEILNNMSTNYQLDQLIRLKGLNNTIYNGKLAKVTIFPSTEVYCNGRYHVELMDEVVPPLRQFIGVKPENMEHVCQRCHKGGENLMSCGKCKNVKYCDRECQLIDWERHKEECQECDNARYVSKHPLFVAIAIGDLGLVQKMVQEGTDVNMTSKSTGITALHIAAMEGKFAIMQYLLQHGTDLNKTDNIGSNPLYMAAQYGHLTVVQCLVERGADKDRTDNYGYSPLFVAAQNGHLPVVRYLLERGADKDKTESNGTSPLFIAAQKGHLPIVQCLVERGVDVNKADNDGMTPLHIAAYLDHTEILSYLMSSGASLTASGNDGDLPIDCTDNEQIKQLIRDEEEKRRRTQVSTEP